MNAERGEAGRREAGRVEAFSDGVFAIAMTLLALDLRVPHGTPGAGLGRELLGLWPAYAAFLTSFTTIGIMWLNHHRLFTLVARVDSRLLLWNAVLLLPITALSFPTSLVANYLGHPGERTAAVAYQATFVVIAIAFNLLWRHLRTAHHPRLLAVPDDHPEVVDIAESYRWGPATYFLCLLLALWSPPLSVALNFGLGLYWAVQSRPTHERSRSAAA